jgi:DNA-binding transcriptional regulator YiaG
MMKKKAKTNVKKNYVFTGLGFPVVIAEVEMRAHGNDCYPVINSRRLEDAVFDYLIDHPIPLTGSQVAFVRKYMDMTQQQFAKALDLSNHSRVSQWERTRDKIADIRPVYLAALRARMAKYRGRATLGTEFFTRMVEGILEKPKTIKFDSAA